MVGTTLRQARERAGLSSKQISATTKIRLARILALEQDDFEHLPSGFYLDAMIRAYAREVHVDPERLVEWSRRERGEIVEELSDPAEGAAGAAGAEHLPPTIGAKPPTLRQAQRRPEHRRKTSEIEWGWGPASGEKSAVRATVALAAALAILGAGHLVFNQAYARFRDASAARSAVEPLPLTSRTVAVPAPALTIPVPVPGLSFAVNRGAPALAAVQSNSTVLTTDLIGNSTRPSPIDTASGDSAEGTSPALRENVSRIDTFTSAMQPPDESLATDAPAR